MTRAKLLNHRLLALAGLLAVAMYAVQVLNRPPAYAGTDPERLTARPKVSARATESSLTAEKEGTPRRQKAKGKRQTWAFCVFPFELVRLQRESTWKFVVADTTVRPRRRQEEHPAQLFLSFFLLPFSFCLMGAQ